MLDRLSVIELHEAGPGHRMHGFSGGIRNEVKVKAGHGTSPKLSEEECGSIGINMGKFG
jgi:hypothetical protein